MLRRIPRLALIAMCAVGLGGFAAVPAQAAGPAVTAGAATAITPTSAVLNGAIVTAGFPTSFAFEYGKTTNYDLATPATAIAGSSGTTLVSAKITGLKPNTTYHFRLAISIATGNYYYPNFGVFSADLTFKTRPVGRLALTSTRIRVHKRIASVRLKCSSVIPCAGKLAITLRFKGRTVRCASKAYAIKAGKKVTVKAKVSRTCIALMNVAVKRSIKAKLTARNVTLQPKVTKRVVLLLK